MNDFFYGISEDLVNIGLIVIEPHKMDGNIFYALVGVMGNKYDGEYTIDIINNEHFIKLATMELTVVKDSVSLFFSMDINKTFSYITYSLLKDKNITFAEMEVTAGFGAFINLIKSVQKVRERLDKSVEVTKKRLRKSYSAKCDMMGKMSETDIKKMVNKDEVKLRDSNKWNDGWKVALGFLVDFINKLE